MTLKEVTKQLHKLSGGHINGEKFTRKELETAISAWLKTGDSYIAEINLPDGNWLFLIERFPTDQNQYDYWIPETRKQEKHLYHLLGIDG